MSTSAAPGPYGPATAAASAARCRRRAGGAGDDVLGLERESERRLLQAARRGDPGAREELVDLFTPSIERVARRYRHLPAIHRGDLIQEGVVGLLRALARYDQSRGTPFWAYASWWVRQAMQQLVSELTLPVVLSDRALRCLVRVKGAQLQHLRDHGAEPSTAQLALGAGLPAAQVELLLAVDRPPRGMEELVRREDGAQDTFGDRVADPCAEDAYERVLRRLAGESVRLLPGALCDRERLVVRERFGLDGPERTLREIADDLGLSSERVRQIEAKALEKLRDATAETKTAEVDPGTPRWMH